MVQLLLPQELLDGAGLTLTPEVLPLVLLLVLLLPESLLLFASQFLPLGRNFPYLPSELDFVGVILSLPLVLSEWLCLSLCSLPKNFFLKCLS